MKIAIHKVTFSVGFDADECQAAAEMAGELVRQCVFATNNINMRYHPSKPEPDSVMQSPEDAGSVTNGVPKYDPF